MRKESHMLEGDADGKRARMDRSVVSRTVMVSGSMKRCLTPFLDETRTAGGVPWARVTPSQSSSRSLFRPMLRPSRARVTAECPPGIHLPQSDPDFSREEIAVVLE